jgi:hypothetical protein
MGIDRDRGRKNFLYILKRRLRAAAARPSSPPTTGAHGEPATRRPPQHGPAVRERRWRPRLGGAGGHRGHDPGRKEGHDDSGFSPAGTIRRHVPRLRLKIGDAIVPTAEDPTDNDDHEGEPLEQSASSGHA